MTSRRLLSAFTAPPPPPPEELPTLAQQLALWFNEEFAVRLWAYKEPTWPPLARAADGWQVMRAIIQLKSSDRNSNQSWRFVRERIDLTYLALLLEQLTGCSNDTGVLSHVAREYETDEIDAIMYELFTLKLSFQLCVKYVVDEPTALPQDTNELCDTFLHHHDHEPSPSRIYHAVRWELEQRLVTASPTWTRHIERFPVQVKFVLFPCDLPSSNEREMEHTVQFVRTLNAPRDEPPAYRRANSPSEGMQTHLPLTGRFASIFIPRALVVTTDFVRAAQDLQFVSAHKCNVMFPGCDPTEATCSEEEVEELQRLLANFQHDPSVAGEVSNRAPDGDHAPPNAS